MKSETWPTIRRRLHRAVRVVRLAASAASVATVTSAAACATTMPEDAATMPSSVELANDDSEAESERIVELEERIAELERDLARVRPTVRASVRLEPAGDPEERPDPLLAGADTFRGPEPDSESGEQGEPPASSGPRTVLRLHASRPAAVDVPSVSERLPVIAMPEAPVPGPGPAMAPGAPVVSGPTNVQALAANAPFPSAEPAPLLAPSAVAVAARAADAAETLELAEYRAGLAHLTGRRYEAAIGALSAFLRDHPGSARAGDALYWRGTAHYALRRYREALIDYERVVRLAPRGERAADSLYHAGLCHRRLGDDARASRAFARLQSEYPDSVAARLALREDTT